MVNIEMDGRHIVGCIREVALEPIGIRMDIKRQFWNNEECYHILKKNKERIQMCINAN